MIASSDSTSLAYLSCPMLMDGIAIRMMRDKRKGFILVGLKVKGCGLRVMSSSLRFGQLWVDELSVKVVKFKESRKFRPNLAIFSSCQITLPAEPLSKVQVPFQP